jgi:hypothetical protein
MRVKPCHYVPQKSDSLVGSERIHRVIMRESRYNPRAVSGGNYGLMQIRLQLHRNCDQRTYLMHLRPSFGLSRAGDWRDIVSVASSPAFAFDRAKLTVEKLAHGPTRHSAFSSRGNRLPVAHRRPRCLAMNLPQFLARFAGLQSLGGRLTAAT